MSEMASELDRARERLKAEAPLPSPPPYLTVDEAALLARCDPKTIRRAFHSGQLQAFRPARRVLLRESDVRAWVERRAAADTERRPAPVRQRRQPPGSVSALRALEREASR